MGGFGEHFQFGKIVWFSYQHFGEIPVCNYIRHLKTNSSKTCTHRCCIHTGLDNTWQRLARWCQPCYPGRWWDEAVPRPVSPMPR